MEARFRQEAPPGEAFDRVLALGRIGVAVLLERPEVSKAVVGSLGLAGPKPSAVRPQSEAIWSLALEDVAGFAAALRPRARAALPQQLAFLFRGCLSFWIAGELSDRQLARAFEAGASTLLLAFADAGRRRHILERIEPLPPIDQDGPVPMAGHATGHATGGRD